MNSTINYNTSSPKTGLLRNKYGSNKGFFINYWHRMAYSIGKYDQYIRTDWGNIKRLVFICKGNICRSAFAEIVARKMGMESISGGVHTILNAPPDDMAILTATSMGYDLSTHYSTPIVYLDLKKTDLLIAMEPWQAELVKNNLARRYETTLLGMWSSPLRPHIYDPFGASSIYFGHCFKYIEKSVHEVIERIQKSN